MNTRLIRFEGRFISNVVSCCQLFHSFVAINWNVHFIFFRCDVGKPKCILCVRSRLSATESSWQREHWSGFIRSGDLILFIKHDKVQGGIKWNRIRGREGVYTDVCLCVCVCVCMHIPYQNMRPNWWSMWWRPIGRKVTASLHDDCHMDSTNYTSLFNWAENNNKIASVIWGRLNIKSI